MGRFVEGDDRRQSLLLPASLDDYVTGDNPVRVVEAFIDELDLYASAEGRLAWGDLCVRIDAAPSLVTGR
jgi:transposase